VFVEKRNSDRPKKRMKQACNGREARKDVPHDGSTAIAHDPRGLGKGENSPAEDEKNYHT